MAAIDDDGIIELLSEEEEEGSDQGEFIKGACVRREAGWARVQS